MEGGGSAFTLLVITVAVVAVYLLFQLIKLISGMVELAASLTSALSQLVGSAVGAVLIFVLLGGAGIAYLLHGSSAFVPH
jgi:hypothetical protein